MQPSPSPSAAARPAHPGSHSRLEELDIFRFVAALMVVGLHYYSDNLLSARYNATYGGSYAFPHLTVVAGYGTLGVDLFFMISGFVIAVSAEGRTLTQFAVSRLSRVFPTYWLACTVCAALLVLSGDREVTSATYWGNMAMAQRGLGLNFIDLVYWTLLIEVRFYVMVGVFVALKRFHWYPAFLYVWALICWLEFAGVPIGYVRQALVTEYGPWFIVGGAAYLMHKGRKPLPLAALALAMTPIMCSKNYRYVQPGLSPEEALVSCGVLVLFVLLMLAVGLGLTGHRHWRRAAWLGSLTYPLYLFHSGPGFVFMHHVYVVSPAVTVGLTLVLALLVAWAVHRWFEQPTMRWIRSRFAPRPRSAAVAPGAT